MNTILWTWLWPNISYLDGTPWIYWIICAFLLYTSEGQLNRIPLPYYLLLYNLSLRVYLMNDDECFCVYADYILFCLCASEDQSYFLVAIWKVI